VTLPAEVIEAKRDGASLPPDTLREFLASYRSGEVAEYQMAAFLMAVYFRGLGDGELRTLTRSILDSGVRLDWEPGSPVVDKHSTGGVGDTVSLILAPLLAEAGYRVPMISGRGLGHTGGTLDKLESIPGFRTDLDLDWTGGSTPSGTSPARCPPSPSSPRASSRRRRPRGSRRWCWT